MIKIIHIIFVFVIEFRQNMKKILVPTKWERPKSRHNSNLLIAICKRT
jgi:hypothetical protein